MGQFLITPFVLAVESADRDNDQYKLRNLGLPYCYCNGPSYPAKKSSYYKLMTISVALLKFVEVERPDAAEHRTKMSESSSRSY